MLKQIGIPPKLGSLLAGEDRTSPLWLVGGAIRDHLLGLRSLDFDFVTSGDAIALARTVADTLSADVYILDRERGAGRVLFEPTAGKRQTYDFSQMRGDTIEADLRARDFTINALAIRISAPDEMVDPCGGLQHLRDGILDLCAADAITQDPIRALRATRIAAEFGLKLSPELIAALRENVSFETISSERVRDEIYNIFALSDPAPALRLLVEFGYLKKIIEPSNRHTFNLSQQSIGRESIQVAIRTVQHLNSIFTLLSSDLDLESAAQSTLGLLTWTLGRYRLGIQEYLQEELNQDRNRRTLILFISFISRMMSPFRKRSVPDDLHKFAIPEEQREVIYRIGEDLRLSRKELSSFDRWMDGLKELDQPVEDLPEMKLFKYKYFKQTMDSGVGAILSMLAFELSSQIEPPSPERWSSKIELARSLFEAWFDQYESIVDPEHLVNGDDVMEVLGIKPGPEIGQVIESVREAQVQGELTSRDQALEFIKRRSIP
jgi:tRNA nucleotidyltransferase/poly(A) polymerase